MPSSALGSFIQEELEKRGWTQRDLEIHSGVSDSTIHRIMNGRSPKMEPLYDIAKALGVSFGRLLTLAGYPVEPMTDDAATLQRLQVLFQTFPWLQGEVENLTKLTPDQRAQLRAIMEVMVRQRKKED
jgi:transcriptional regulator with XRE-family HTH domain